MMGFNQMMELEYIVKCKKKKITVGEALRHLIVMDMQCGCILDIKG